MNNKLSLLEQISKVADKEAIMKMLLAQLEKDFGEFGLFPDLKEASTQSLDLLVQAVAKQLRNADIRSGNQLLSLFYRIDVPAKFLTQGLEKPQEERYPFLAREVLNRELKKVITRLAYTDLNG